MIREKLKMGMPPVHPGEFIRAEILNELRLSINRVRAATLSDLVGDTCRDNP